MTTFTSEDRENAMNTPTVIVDSGASVKGTREMTQEELIDALDQRYGNPHAKECHLIQEAIKVLKLQSDEIKALYAQLKDKK